MLSKPSSVSSKLNTEAGWAWRGAFGLGSARFGTAGVARRGKVSQGPVWKGRLGGARRGGDGLGSARRGKAGVARRGRARHGVVGLGSARQASIVVVGRGWAWSGRRGRDWLGAVGPGLARQAWQG